MTDHDVNFDRRTFLKTVGIAGVSVAASGVAAATPGREPGAKKDEILVGVSAGSGRPRDVVSEHVSGRAQIVHENQTLRYVAVTFPEEATDRARENFKDALTNRPDIKYAEDNATHTSFLTPNDPKFDEQYAPQMVNAPEAWETTQGSSSVTVAIVDQGIQYDHPDLNDNMSTAVSDHGRDFVDDDTDPYPDSLSKEYHGTHVGGIAAAETDNDTGVAGISESSLLSGRALNEDGSGSTSDIADAIQWAADAGADVINLSLGGGGYTDTMKNAVSYAYDNGVFIAAAAGNAGNSSVSYPAAYSECLAVSALAPDGSFASYSNYGDKIELTAPGSNVLSSTTTENGSYKELSGTSMATPVVSGVAGLALAQWDVTNAELRSHLKTTAVDVGLSEDKQGSGRVDADNAVSTDPSGDGSDGTQSTSGTASGSLSGYWDADCLSWQWQYSDPDKVVIELSGPSDADFDLYANDGTGDCPTTSDFDYRSWSTDSQETIVIDNPDVSTELYVLVDSYSGSGSYEVTLTEYK